MKKFILLGAAIGVAAASNPAVADDSLPYYVSLTAGWSHTGDTDYSEPGLSGDIDIDDTISYSGAIGKNFTRHIRGELEVSYRNADLDEISVDGAGSADLGGDFSTLTALINGYYDFMPNKTISPYITAGVGLARHDIEVDSVAGLGVTGAESDDVVFAYQAGAGVDVHVARRTTLFGGYRYLGSSDPDLDGTDFEYDAHEIRAGIRYQF